jgi:lysophospholipase L1-like esterase
MSNMCIIYCILYKKNYRDLYKEFKKVFVGEVILMRNLKKVQLILLIIVFVFLDIMPIEVSAATSTPYRPIGLIATPQYKSIVLKWIAVPKVFGYNIRRSTTGIDGSFIKINKKLINSTEYVDLGLKDTTKYYYVVSAVNSAGESNFSFPDWAKTCIEYTSLGDSIACGQGASDSDKSFASLLYQNLKSRNGNSSMRLNNLGIIGYKSSDLLKSLRNDNYYKYCISRSKVITISIGGNNILGPTLDVLKQEFDISPWNFHFSDEVNEVMNDYSKYQTFLGALAPKLDSSCDTFVSDWSKIISTVKSMSPNAKIYVMTVYNPLDTNDRLYYLFNRAINRINSVIKYSAASRYSVADVYRQFSNYNSSELSHANSSFLDPHPTDKGHRVIYRTFAGIIR